MLRKLEYVCCGNQNNISQLLKKETNDIFHSQRKKKRERKKNGRRQSNGGDPGPRPRHRKIAAGPTRGAASSFPAPSWFPFISAPPPHVSPPISKPTELPAIPLPSPPRLPLGLAPRYPPIQSDYRPFSLRSVDLGALARPRAPDPGRPFFCSRSLFSPLIDKYLIGFYASFAQGSPERNRRGPSHPRFVCLATLHPISFFGFFF